MKSGRGWTGPRRHWPGQRRCVSFSSCQRRYLGRGPTIFVSSLAFIVRWGGAGGWWLIVWTFRLDWSSEVCVAWASDAFGSSTAWSSTDYNKQKPVRSFQIKCCECRRYCFIDGELNVMFRCYPVKSFYLLVRSLLKTMQERKEILIIILLFFFFFLQQQVVVLIPNRYARRTHFFFFFSFLSSFFFLSSSNQMSFQFSILCTCCIKRWKKVNRER